MNSAIDPRKSDMTTISFIATHFSEISVSGLWQLGDEMIREILGDEYLCEGKMCFSGLLEWVNYEYLHRFILNT
jgi:hypothetical protein